LAVVDPAARAVGRVAAHGAIVESQRGAAPEAVVEDGGAEAPGPIFNSQAVDGDIGASVDLKYAKGRRDDSGAALKRRSIAVDNQRMAGVAQDHRQAVIAIGTAIIDNGESVSAISRQLDCVVLAVSVGRGDGRD